MSREDLTEAFKAATGLDDDAIKKGYGELENTDPEKYSYISFDYSDLDDGMEIQVRDHSLDKNPYSSYATIYLYDYKRNFDALLWATEFDGKYISGLELSNEMTMDDILKMLDFDTLKELAGDNYYEDEYQIQLQVKDVKNAETDSQYKYLTFFQQKSVSSITVEISAENCQYTYTYNFKDDKLDRFGVSIYPK